MAISSRPSLEAFINKGGSSVASEETVPAPPRPKKDSAAAAPRERKTKAAPAPPPVEVVPPKKPLGRPRKQQEDALKFVMRIPPYISSELDAVVGQRKIPVSRNAWILEAIVEKIERDISASK